MDLAAECFGLLDKTDGARLVDDARLIGGFFAVSVEVDVFLMHVVSAAVFVFLMRFAFLKGWPSLAGPFVSC